jgi:hypothetical protein
LEVLVTDLAERERSVASVGQKVVELTTAFAGVVVAVTGAFACCGFFYFAGYLTTIGAPWARDLLAVSAIIQYGAPITSVIVGSSLLAMLIFARADAVPNFNKVFISLAFFLAIASFMLFVFMKGESASFWIQISAAFLIAVALPYWIIRVVVAWKGSHVGTIAVMINALAIASILPLSFGIMKGFLDRLLPEQLSRVVLKGQGASNQDWRLVLPVSDGVLITKGYKNEAFTSYKIVRAEDIEIIFASRSLAPWAPEAPDPKLLPSK